MTPAAKPSAAALRKHHDRVTGMLNDPQLTGDLLLVGLMFAHLVDYYPDQDWQFDRLVHWVFPCPPHMHGPAHRTKATRQFVAVLRKDIRRYTPPPSDGTCKAPVRGRVTACGRSGRAHGVTITDPDTGEQKHLQACTRHVEWVRTLSQDNRTLITESPPPLPYANTGGVLREHLPELHWEKMWRRLDATWTAHPEPGEDPRPRAPLRAIAGGSEGGIAAAPTLSVVR